jgi:putative phosphoribosyl transferase
MKRKISTGALLAEKLALWSNCDGFIIAVSKTGAAIAHEVARDLQLPVHMSYCTGIPDPAAPDKSIGSVSLESAITHATQHDLPQDYLAHQVRQLQNELRHSVECFREQISIKDKVVIIIDSHIHSIDNLLATIEFVKRQKPLEIIVAANTISLNALRDLDRIVDEVFYVESDSDTVGVRFFRGENLIMN